MRLTLGAVMSRGVEQTFAVVQNAVIGNDTSLGGGIIGAITILALNWAVVEVSYRFKPFRRLMEGLSAMNCRMKTMSSAVTARPRYRHSTGICRQCARTKTGTQALVRIISMRSRAATRELLRYPDYQRRAVTAPDVRAVSLPVRFLSATT